MDGAAQGLTLNPPLYIFIVICYNVSIYGDEEEEYVRQSEPAVVRGRRWTEGVSELFPE